jgi:hypothetical protein
MVSVLVLCGVAAAGLGVLLVRGRPAGDPVFGLLAIIELVLVVQVVVGSVQLSGTSRDVSGALFVSYLLGSICALPAGFLLWVAERTTRAGTAIMLVATVTVAALELRLDAIWGGAGA